MDTPGARELQPNDQGRKFGKVYEDAINTKKRKTGRNSD